MDLKWYSSHIKEEIEGAEEYAKDGLHKMHEGEAQHDRTFKHMAEQELEHAQEIIKMLKETEIEGFSAELKQYIIDSSTNDSDEIRYYINLIS